MSRKMCAKQCVRGLNVVSSRKSSRAIEVNKTEWL